MNCNEVRDELVAYVRGELDPDPHAQVEEHLARCQACTQELEGARRVLAITQMADEEAIAALTHRITRSAIGQRASDIHLETGLQGPRLRFRVDGLLREMDSEFSMSREQAEATIARFKMLGECSVMERRLPQDGRVAVRDEAGKELDLRLSFLPAIHGENLVIRILDRSKQLVKLEEVGFLPDTFQAVQELLRRPRGLLLSTGPTGSGKSTLMYSMLQYVNAAGVKLLSVEDPVEYALPGVTQVQVSRPLGIGFATALRVIMRQDPDVIMVGEVPDAETAALSMHAALTGHLVLTQLHAGDSATAIFRLLEIGVAPFLVAGSVIGVVSQRLTRRLCLQCRAETDLPLSLVQAHGGAGFTLPAEPTFYKPVGCSACRGTGFYGRMPIHELLEVTPEIQELIARHASAAAIRQAALNAGMRTLTRDALSKAALGLTSVEEALRSATDPLFA